MFHNTYYTQKTEKWCFQTGPNNVRKNISINYLDVISLATDRQIGFHFICAGYFFFLLLTSHGTLYSKREAIFPSGFNMSNESYFVAMEMMHQKQK